MELEENEFLAIGDVHGNYKTLMSLLKKSPDVLPISLGDEMDRGPRSFGEKRCLLVRKPSNRELII